VSGFFLCEVLLAAVQNLSDRLPVGLVSFREIQISLFDLLAVFSEPWFSVGKCNLPSYRGLKLRHRLGNFWQSSCGLRERIAEEQLDFSFEASRVNKNNQNNPWQKAKSHPQDQLPNSS
jgi:hypothetical protein